MKKATPVDFRSIRQTLGLTMKQMGILISAYTSGVSGTPIPETRINEWETGCRSVPEYVSTASAKLLLDFWSEDRHKAPDETKADVDIFYGGLLCPPLGEIFRLEAGVRRGDINHRELLQRVEAARKAQLEFLEKQLRVATAYVFSPGLDPNISD